MNTVTLYRIGFKVTFSIFNMLKWKNGKKMAKMF